MQVAHRDPCHDQLMGRPQGWRQRCRVQVNELPLGLIEPADQQQATDAQITRVGCIDKIAVGLQRDPRRFQRLHRPTKIPRGQCDLGFGDGAACPRHDFFRPKGPRGHAYQRFGPHQIPQLRHGDTAQCQRGRIVAQRDPVQRTQRIARRQRLRCGGDQRIHCSPATRVTPAVISPYESISPLSERIRQYSQARRHRAARRGPCASLLRQTRTDAFERTASPG
ncbi:hypothetical protein D3C76_1054010 [compost metagenome]